MWGSKSNYRPFYRLCYRLHCHIDLNILLVRCGRLTVDHAIGHVIGCTIALILISSR